MKVRNLGNAGSLSAIGGNAFLLTDDDSRCGIIFDYRSFSLDRRETKIEFKVIGDGKFKTPVLPETFLTKSSGHSVCPLNEAYLFSANGDMDSKSYAALSRIVGTLPHKAILSRDWHRIRREELELQDLGLKRLVAEIQSCLPLTATTLTMAGKFAAVSFSCVGGFAFLVAAESGKSNFNLLTLPDKCKNEDFSGWMPVDLSGPGVHHLSAGKWLAVV